MPTSSVVAGVAASDAFSALLPPPLRFWRSIRCAACRRPSLRSTCTSSSCSGNTNSSGNVRQTPGNTSMWNRHSAAGCHGEITESTMILE